MEKLNRHRLVVILVLIILLMLSQRYVKNAWQRNIIYLDMFRGSQIDNFDSSSRVRVFNSNIEASTEAITAMLTSVDQFRKVLQRFPDDQSAAYGLAFAASKTGQYETAAMAFNMLERRRASVLFPFEVLAFSKVGIINKLDSKERAAIAEQLARFGWQYLVTGRRDDAVVIYELATDVDPRALEIWLDRIEIYANEWDKALNAYEDASLIFPDDPYLLLAGAYVNLNQQGYYDRGVELLHRAMPMLKDLDISRLSRAQLAWLYYGYVMSADVAIQEGNIAQARIWLKQAVELPSVSIAPYLAQAKLTSLNNS